MPQMDGLEVLTRLKGTAATSSIPVILLTAKVQYEDALKGYKLGADHYMPKPFPSTQLINIVDLVSLGVLIHCQTQLNDALIESSAVSTALTKSKFWIG